MTDEGANLQGLPIDELQKQSKVLHDRVDEIVGERQPRDADAQDYIREVLRLVTQAMHYSDALLVKLPLDRSIYAEGNRGERSEQFYKLAQQAMRDSIAVDNAPLGYALLAEMLIQNGEEEEVEEAEKLLHEAEKLDPSPAEATVISPNYPAIWYNIGHIQYALERYDEAVDSLKRAIETDNDLRAYAELAA